MTMSELEELGFKVVKSYVHDDYVTQRRKRGCMTIETTWDKNKGHRVSQDMVIDETYIDAPTKEQVKSLTKILE